MEDQSATTSGIPKMDQARRLMEKGRHRESLLLALEVLFEELAKLRESLLALQMITRLELETSQVKVEKEPPQDPFWLPLIKRARILH